jgi:hypothetical protein
MTFRVERDGYVLEAQVRRLGEDLVVLLGGGELPHVGTTVVAEPRASGADPTRRSATSSVLNRLGHKDEALARPLAERLAAALDVTVVVVAGVHVEDLDQAGIQIFADLAEELMERMLRDLIAGGGTSPAGAEGRRARHHVRREP